MSASVNGSKVGAAAPVGPDADLNAALELCVHKTRGNIKRLADAPVAAAWAVDGNYFQRNDGFLHIDNWTSSFFTGMALLAWRETEDEHFLKETLRLAPSYRDKVFPHHLQTHHDLGFLYTLYSVALYKLTGAVQHREVGLRAAELLAQRFNAKGNFIRAWGPMNTADFADMAIIDCMMNLPLLYWAANQTQDRRYHDIAVKHADMALRTFIRPDDTVYHAYRFDLHTGKPARGDTYGGCTAESAWARGAGWAIYGFALSHRYTGDERYLDASLRVAKKFIAHLDAEVIPLWDLKPEPTSPLIRDASAASVAVCGFQELERQNKANASITAARQALLNRLCSPDYLNFDDACPGIQKNGQVGNGHPGGAQNAYTSWGDYFLMEALCRELKKAEVFW